MVWYYVECGIADKVTILPLCFAILKYQFIIDIH